MNFVRIYTGEDNNAHFEKHEATDQPYAKGVDATFVNVRTMAVGTELDWHPAPGHIMFFHLAGQLEVELRDGSKHIFGPGSIRLMDDVTGTGHLTRVIGTEPVIHAAVMLKE